MVVNELKSRSIYVLLIVSLGVLFLAYQVRTPLELDLGARGDDAYITGFHDPEYAGDISYRWSSDSSVVSFQGVATWTPADLRLRLNGSRPPDMDPPHVTVLANGTELVSFVAVDQFETYEIPIDQQVMGLSGALEIEIRSDSFVPADYVPGDDLRRLGVMVDDIAMGLRPTSCPLLLPPLPQLLVLVGSVAACFLWARQFNLSTNISLIVAGFLLAVVSGMVLAARLWLGQHHWWFLLPLVCLNVATILARPLSKRLKGTRGVSALDLKDLHLLLVVAVVLACLFYLRFGVWQPLHEDQATDFFINYTAATVLTGGGNIYDADSLREGSQHWNQPTVAFDFGSLFVTYITPPTHVILLLPLVPLGYEKARIVFLLLSNGLLFVSLALFVRTMGVDALRPPRLLLSLLLVLAFQPVYSSLQLGQVDFVILFLLAVSYWAYKRDKRLLVGPCLAVAALIKLSPAVLIVYFLWKREYLVFVSAAATALVAGLAALLLAGRDAMLTFASTILPALLKGTAFFQNQSLNGFFSRLFVHHGRFYSLQEFPSVPHARGLSLLVSILLLGVAAYVTRHAIRKDSLRFDLELSLAMVLMLLVSSVSWDHYLTWLLPVFLILLSPTLRRRVTAGAYALGMACGWVGYVLMAIPVTLYGLTLHSYAGSSDPGLARVLLLSLGTYGQLLLFLCVAALTVGLRPGRHIEAVSESGRQGAETRARQQRGGL
jgi:hypothetical protein